MTAALVGLGIVIVLCAIAMVVVTVGRQSEEGRRG